MSYSVIRDLFMKIFSVQLRCIFPKYFHSLLLFRIFCRGFYLNLVADDNRLRYLDRQTNTIFDSLKREL